MSLKLACFSTHDFERAYLESNAKIHNLEAEYFNVSLTKETLELAKGHKAICCWASDDLGKKSLEKLSEFGIEMISLRSAGFSHLDLETARKLKLTIARVPSYSPEAIAEHTLGLLMCLNRHYPKSFQRVKDFNFTLEGLEGVTLKGKSVGIIGVGLIGQAFARIMKGMGCKIFFHDIAENIPFSKEVDGRYLSLEDLLKQSDIVSLHCPLNENTKYILNAKNIGLMKEGSFLLNTGRGALIETHALIENLKKSKFRGVGLDVYEYEEGVFFKDHSSLGLSDETLLRLMSFPRVLITSHQGFFTEEALQNIAKTSISNVASFFKGENIDVSNLVS